LFQKGLLPIPEIRLISLGQKRRDTSLSAFFAGSPKQKTSLIIIVALNYFQSMLLSLFGFGVGQGLNVILPWLFCFKLLQLKYERPLIIGAFCKSPIFVIPAQAGIQTPFENMGVQPCCQGMRISLTDKYVIA